VPAHSCSDGTKCAKRARPRFKLGPLQMKDASEPCAKHRLTSRDFDIRPLGTSFGTSVAHHID